MIEIQNLSKSYRTASGQVEALKDVSITIGSGDIYGIIGMSGAGKSTLFAASICWSGPARGESSWTGRIWAAYPPPLCGRCGGM